MPRSVQKISRADQRHARAAFKARMREIDHDRPVFHFNLPPGPVPGGEFEITFAAGEPLPTREQAAKKRMAMAVHLPQGEWTASINWEAGTIDIRGLKFREVE